MNRSVSRLLIFALVVTAFSFAAARFMNKADATEQAQLLIKQEGNEFVLSAGEIGEFHRTTRQIVENRLITLADSRALVMLWKERAAIDGREIPFYAVSLDGKSVSRLQEADYNMLLRYATFDPLKDAVEVPAALQHATTETDENGVYIVQFVTQPLEEYREQIRAFGGKDFIYLPNHAHLVMMNSETRAKVESLPFVRWVGRYEPAYKLEEYVRENLLNNSLSKTRYNIMVLERGSQMQNRVANRIQSLGGKVENTMPQGFRIEATLDKDQLLNVAQANEVLFIDRWSAPESDMDVVRATGGANFIETTLGFTGQGVRAEVMDGGLRLTHTDFQAGGAPIVHGPAVSNDSHGTATYGINFGRGTANPQGRGMLPAAQGIIASYSGLTNRYTHTAELKQAPYFAVYQSNSWGSSLTTAYNTISAEMDDILFINDFVLLNSQSNAGTQSSRPQAWAKNVVSVGGVRHYNTATFDDDRWANGASVGPAADGRLKPDLAHFYDNIFTTTSTNDTAYTTGFGGTSAATPITAGHFGIFFQMWHNGIFGNPTGATVFDSRPHMTTAKAVMINTAVQWNMTGTDLTRARQGFGRVDVKNLYELRGKMKIVDEADVLTNLQTKSYAVTVPAGSTTPLKITMVYNDPMGSPSATRARINDLTLKVTAPDNTVYWGNNGLGVGGGMWSTPGGAANIVDTVENVFIQTPAAGTWIIEVTAAELNQDARTETPGVIDADFALVASGVTGQSTAAPRTRFDYDGDGKADISVFRPLNGTWYQLNSQNGSPTAVQFGQNGDVIAPADYDGDGKFDRAVFRAGTWFVQGSSQSVSTVQWGIASDVPVPADFDGDNKADYAVFRPSNNTWYVLRSAGGSSTVQFGASGDVPTVGDYDGDGKADISVFRSSDGTWYRISSGNGQPAAVQWGISGDKAVPADYDGDGKTDLAVFRPSNATWYLLRSQLGASGLQFGLSSDVPVPADYDGDGRADVAVYRAGVWYAQQTGAGLTTAFFGLASDEPTPAAYIP